MARTILSIAICLAVGLPLFAQDCLEPDPADQMEIQQKMMALMGPGPEHALLERFVGEWEGTTSMYMMPGAEPMSSQITQSVQPVLGSRYVQSTATGTIAGMQIDSISMIGFDRRHAVYTMIGFDSTGTYYITAEGSYDEETRTLRFQGSDEDPIGGITQVYEFVFEFVDDDNYTLTLIFHCPTFGTGEAYKLFEQKMTRKS